MSMFISKLSLGIKKLLFLTAFLPLVSFAAQSYNKEAQFFKLNGETVSYEELINGSDKTILFFWTTWCYFCRKELTKVNKHPLDLGMDGVKIYYVNLGQDFKTVNYSVENLELGDFIADNIIIDKQSFLAREFNIIGIPAYIFIEFGRPVYKSNVIDNQIIKDIFK